jgi:hypothetical protein
MTIGLSILMIYQRLKQEDSDAIDVPAEKAEKEKNS